MSLFMKMFNSNNINNVIVYGDGIKVNDETFEIFLDNLLNPSLYINKIDFSYKKLTDDSFQSLCQCLSNNKTVKYLNLTGNEMITENGWKYFCTMLILNDSIVNINLSRNHLTKNVFKFLCESLTINHTVKSINLSYNNINDEKIENFSELFTNNNSIKHLIISDNRIGDKGFTCLLKSIEKKDSVLNLYLANNDITDRGIENVYDYLLKMKTLHYIDFSYNPINENGIGILNIISKIRVDFQYTFIQLISEKKSKYNILQNKMKYITIFSLFVCILHFTVLLNNII